MIRKGMRRLPMALLAISLTGAASVAHAESDVERLREALRRATSQARALEDERAATQARLADAERERGELQAQIGAAKAEADASKEDVKKLQKQLQDATDEFNTRTTERDQTLEKWKAAYEEAVNVARSKDAERQKFQAQANAFKASGKKCVERNNALIKVGRELLERYDAVTIGDTISAREPLVGYARVEVQKFLQDYTDKILDQKVDP